VPGRYTYRTFAREAVLVLITTFFCFPLYLMVTISLDTNRASNLTPLKPPLSDPQVSNYSVAWKTGGQFGLGHALQSSLIITITSVVAVIAIGSVCAYAIARRGGRLMTAFYFAFVVGIILPFQLAIIPLYVAMHKLGLIGNYLGIILLFTGLLTPLTVFLYTGFIRALPRDYEEAAQVDGAGFFRTYLRVVFPLLRPVTGTVAVLAGLVIWNDFFITLIFLSGSRYQTLPVALYSFVGQYDNQWNLMFAAVAISIAPILLFYLFAQRQLIRGFSTGVKG
jgi:raffinose/stachyose/melibiose transport system permease protein